MSNTSIARASVGRSIPSAPLRILDAPDLVDDYYLNLISWGHNNVSYCTLSLATNLLPMDATLKFALPFPSRPSRVVPTHLMRRKTWPGNLCAVYSAVLSVVRSIYRNLDVECALLFLSINIVRPSFLSPRHDAALAAGVARADFLSCRRASVCPVQCMLNRRCMQFSLPGCDDENLETGTPPAAVPLRRAAGAAFSSSWLMVPMYVCMAASCS